LGELEKISPKIDSRLKDYSDSMLKAVKIYSGGRGSGEKDAEFVKRLKKEWEEVSAKRKKLMGDPEIMEELY
jgi:hypothetical protein